MTPTQEADNILQQMNWYYVELGQQRGPVTEADLESLFQSGNIQGDSLVWREGMSEWQAYQQIKSVAGASVMTLTPPPAGGAVCTECGRIFPADEVIRHGNSTVCAGCKPTFLQKLKEGVSLRGDMVYAGFWIRFGAKFLDGIILWVLGTVAGMVTGFVLSQAGPILLAGAGLIVGVVINATYNTLFIGKFGATPGKMAAKIRVVNADGTPVSYGKALARYFAEMVSGLTLGIGYIMAAFDDEKRALHDRICGTRVIKK